MMKNADTALYHAKKIGRNNYQFYASEMTVLAQERVMLETALRYALQREEFLLYYLFELGKDIWYGMGHKYSYLYVLDS